jgi:uncharacterized repeat protein (TIGR02543 family)
VKRKIFLVLLTITALVSAVVGFAACGSKKHTHSYVESEVVAATCKTDGYTLYVCSDCGDTMKDDIVYASHTVVVDAAEEATCKHSGKTQGTHCSVCGDIIKAQEVVATQAHSYVSGVCRWCNTEKVYTITFMSLNTVVKTATFTVSNKNVTAPAVPDVAGYKDGKWESYTLGTEDVVVNAVYTLIKKSITYENIDGATNSNPSTYTVESGDLVLADATKTGFTFLGWYNNNKKVTSIKSTVDGDITLTAQWEITEYTITVKNARGADVTSIPTKYTIETDTIVLPTIFVEGYTFKGWSLNDKIVTKIEKGTTGNITITAVMTANKYNITLNSEGGTLNSDKTKIEYGSDYTLPVPTYAGKNFLGWYDGEGDSANKYTDSDGNSLNAYDTLDDKTLYAHWEAQKFTVTFNTDGGSEVEKQVYEYGDKFNPEETIKDKYLFDGWYSEDGSVEYTSETKITSDITVYAKWIQSVAISDAAGLIAIAEDPTLNYHLTKDINLNNEVWTPINEFSGKLNGNGYTIKNFVLTSTAPGDNFGFIRVNSGTIDDLNFADFTYNISTTREANTNTGVFVGTNNGTLSNCNLISGVIKFYYIANGSNYYLRMGSCVGQNYGKISNCSSRIDITGRVEGVGKTYSTFDQNFYVGGIAGENNAGKILNCSVSASININSAISGASNYCSYENIYSCIGGIIGQQYNNAECLYSYADVEINYENVGIFSRASDNAYIGGIVGVSNGSSIEDCYSNGTISGGAATYSAFGGLVGRNHASAKVLSSYSSVVLNATVTGDIGGFVGANESVIQNSYASGQVAAAANSNTGGFVGNNTSSGTTFKCYSTGDVSTTSGSVGYFIGTNNGVISKCYYMSGAVVTLAGKALTTITEYDTIEGMLYSRLWSEDFLVDEMYWDEEGWVILTDENPLLDWELTTSHDFVTTTIEPDCLFGGFTVYSCNDCNRFFFKDYVEALGHNWEDVSTVSATCEYEGYTLQRCTRDGCGEEQKVNIVPATGHPAAKVTIKSENRATCTKSGYVIYHCAECNSDYRVDESAKGHNGELVKTVKEASCGEDGEGEATYLCNTCLEEYDVVLPKTEHTWVDVAYEPAKCNTVYNSDGKPDGQDHGTNGNQPGSKCEVCGEIQYGCEIIYAHNFELIETINSTSCSSAGSGTYKCTICEYEKIDEIAQLKHTDANRDSICDVCGELVFSTVSKKDYTHIASVDELLAIRNMNGYFWLDVDIDLTGIDWSPIGTEDQPFKGIFYGAGHTISGLKVTVNDQKETTVAGIFGYNKGTIVYLNVSDFEVNVNNSSCVFGGIAAYNYGYILNCSVTGANSISFGNTLTITDYSEHTQEYTLIAGGIVGVNEQTGNIESCVVAGSISNRYINISEILTEVQNTIWQYIGQAMKQYVYSTKATTIEHISFGGIAGRNEGTISTCAVTSSITSYSEAESYLEHMKGEAFAYTYMYAGALVGVNSGTVISCSATKMSYDIKDGYRYVNVPYIVTGKVYSMGYEIINYAKLSDGVDGIVGTSTESGKVTNLTIA